MADNNSINIGLNVTSNGTLAAETKNAKALTDQLKEAAKSAKSALTGSGSATIAKAKSRASSTEENIDYGIQRSTVGTGAAGRDFAKQSKGLGGLVHLYATFAANIFAVSAAFTALSSAADTTNMVKGLDQLGASSGRSLGTLSKKLAIASEGAISLRDSMESVAKASSAGLNDSQILQLGESAKKAAQALGLSMPDALSRLTRGISKLEPELLDELGIFIRIDDVTRKYALSVGKAAGSLTDFERRQAFANAVLDQAKSKFGEITIDVNPYSKLLASFQNISYAGLDLVNKVLGPLVKILAESPTGLSTVLALIAGKLISVAVPAIGAWRSGLKAAAEESAKTARVIADSFGEAFQGRLEAHFKLPDLEKNLANINARIARVKTVDAGSAPTTLPKTFANATNDLAGLKAVNAAIETRNERLATGFAGQTKLSAAGIKTNQDEIAYLNKKSASISSIIEKNVLLLAQGKAQAALTEAQDKAQNIADKSQGRFDPEVLAFRQATKARAAYDKISAVSNAAETARVLGVRLAWQGLTKEISEKGITGLDKWTTLAKGGLASVGTRIMGIVGAFGQIGIAIGIGIAAFNLLSDWLSTNTKEVEAFNSSIEDSIKSTEVLRDTLAKIAKKDTMESLSIESFTARNKAILGISDSLTKLADDYGKVVAKEGTFSKFTDMFLKPFGKDLKSKFSKNISNNIVDALEGMEDGPAKAALEDKLKSVLGTTDLTVDNIKNIINGLSGGKLLQISNDAIASVQNTAKALDKSSTSVIVFKDGLTSTAKAYQEMTVSLTASDPISKLGALYVSNSSNITDALGSVNTGIAAMQELLSDSSKLSLLPIDSQKLLLSYSDSIKSTAQDIRNYANALAEAKAKLVELQKVTEVADGGGNITQVDNSAAIKAQQGLITELNRSIDAARDSQRAIVTEFGKVGADMFKTGVGLIFKQLDAARERVTIDLLKAKTSQAEGYAKVAIDTKLQKEEIDIQLRAIKVQEDLVVQQTRTNLLLTEDALRNKQKALQDTPVDKQDVGALAAVTDELKAVEAVNNRLLMGLGKLDFTAGSAKEQKYLAPLISMAVKSRAESITAQGKKAALSVTEGLQNKELDFSTSQNRQKDTEKLLALDKERYATISSIMGIENMEALLKKQTTEESARLKTIDIARNELINNIAKAEDVASKVANEATKKQVSIEKEKLSAFEKSNAELTAQKRINEEIEVITSRYAKFVKDMSKDRDNLALAQELAKVYQDSDKSQLDYLVKLGALSEETALIRQANLDKEAELLDRNNKLTAVSQVSTDARDVVNKTFESSIASSGGNSLVQEAARQKQKEDLDNINELERKRIRLLEEQYAIKEKYIDLYAKDAVEVSRVSNLTNTLSKVFGDLGDSIGKFGTGFGNILKSTFDYEKKRVALANDTKTKLGKINTDSIEGIQEYNKVKTEGEKESTKLAIDSAAEQASAAKSMFSEKTFAYKAFAAVEKAIQVAKLAMMVQEMTVSLATAPAIIAAEGAKSAAKGTGAILSALSAPFPINFIAGALMAAIVASLLGGGKKASIPSGVSAEDMQKTQGTGSSWVNGKIQENGAGVFGDSSAKSESIAKSLEVIKQTAVEGLSFSNKMVNILEKINTGINGAAKSLYSIPGIRTGSQFGTKEGTNTSGGIGGILGGVLGAGFFGKTVTKNIIDSGIQIQGTFLDISNSAKNVVKGFETVSVTTKHNGLFGIGGSTSTSTDRQFTNLDKTVSDQISEVFSHATNLFIDVGGKLGITVESVLTKLGNIRIDQLASLKGLSGADLENELNAVLGNILDSASNTLFESMKKFQKFGEGMLETVIRVVDSNEKIKLSFDSIGKLITTLSFETTDALTNLTGGLSTFLDQVAGYKDTFLSEAEKLVPIREAVTKELAALGFASVKTKDDFKYLINGLDVTTESGQKTFTALLAVSESFSRLADAADATDNLRIDLIEAEGRASEATALRRAKELKQMSATDAAIQIRIWMLEDEKKATGDYFSYQYKILQLLGKSSEALAANRANELSLLDPQLTAVQKYIYAIEDEISIRDRASKAIDTTINSFKNSITTLKDLRSSLLGGDKSILTPQQKYDQAKKDAQAIIEAASAPASSVESILVREAAISKLPQVTELWLEASRNLYASSSTYNKDFTTVISALDSASAAVGAQLTDAEKQLEVLKSNSNILTAIDDNTKSTNELLNQFLVAAQATKAAEAQVPSFVPGATSPVIMPDTSNTVNQELVAELIKFNKEALDKQLKAQEEATAAIIRANAIAEAANAQAIIAAQEAAMERDRWNSKNTPIIDGGYGSYSYNPGGG